MTPSSHVTDSFTVQVTDDLNATASVAAVFHIDDSNDNPTVSAAAPTATLVEAGGVDNGTAGTAASSITLTKRDDDGIASSSVTGVHTCALPIADTGVTYTKAGTYGTATLTVASNVVS